MTQLAARVHPEAVGQRRAVLADQTRLDPGALTLFGRLPGDQSAAVRQRHKHGMGLVAHRHLVDQELGSGLPKIRRKAARDHRTLVSILAEGAPGDPQAALGVDICGRKHLHAADIGIDLHLSSHGFAGRSEAPGVDPVGALLLAATLPDQHGALARPMGHRHRILCTARELIGPPFDPAARILRLSGGGQNILLGCADETGQQGRK